MKQLLSGIDKYQQSVYPSQKPLFDQLAKGQSPPTLWITCSDSRLDPCLLTQTQPGELFVIRNAGNIIPPYGSSHGGEEPTVEYAMEGLKVKNIVVCGHSHCGAMGALLNKKSVEGLPAVSRWLSHAESTLRKLNGELDLPRAIEQNVLSQIDNLKTHPSVASAIVRGEVKLFGSVYHFESGQVSLYQPQTKSFVPTSELQGMDLDSLSL